MTTEVIIKANHGWPVLAQALTAGGGAVALEPIVVPAGETRSLYVHSGQDLLIHEVQPDGASWPEDEPILKYFVYSHLPDRLKVVSMTFAFMALRLVHQLPRSPERTVALRKLLEAKDCAVRAAVEA